MPSLLVGLKMKSGLPKPKPVHSALPIPQKPTRPSALPLTAKSSPAKSEKSAPAKSDPAKSDPAKSDLAKSAPAKSAPAKSDPTKSDPVKSAPARSDRSDRSDRAAATGKGHDPTKAKGRSARVEKEEKEDQAEDEEEARTEAEAKAGSAKESGGSLQIYTDWANHYLSKSGHKRLIRDLQTDVSDGVLLAEIIQVVANEKIGEIHGCPRSRAQMIQNIDACLSFLAAKGVNIQGLSAEEIGNGNLKAILGLFFSLSRFKQQQQKKNPPHPSPHPPPHPPHPPHPPLTQHSSAPPHLASPHGAPPAGHRHTAQGSGALADMQSRLPGPSSRVAAADAARVGSNANRRSQVFDKSKAPAARDSSESLTCHTSPAMTEHAPSPVTTASIQSATSSSSSAANNNTAIPQPNATSKLWRSKPAANKNSAPSAASAKTHDANAKNGAASDHPPKAASQRSMLEKLKLFNSKSSSKSSPENNAPLKLSETASNTDSLEAEEGNVRPGANGNANTTTASSPKIALRGIAQRTFSRALTTKKSSAKESSVKSSEKEKSKVKAEEAKDEMLELDSNKRTSKIASFIPKGGKVAKKEAQSGIPKPGAKNPAVKASARLAGGVKAADRGSKHSSSTSSLASTEGQRAAGSTGNSACSVAAAAGTTQSTASNTVSVQLPQTQQLHSHPNMATVAPFMYRSQEADVNTDGRDCSKANLTAIEDISDEDPETRRLRTVKNIADLRQNLEETMSSLRGTQLTHSSLDSSFEAADSNGGRSLLSRPHLSSSWRLGSAVPRLQAGDAPSLANGCRGAGPGRYLYSAHLRRQLTGRGGAGEGSEPMGDEEELEGVAVEMTGYMSDGDVLSKSLARADDVTSGYLTDGGLGLYTRRLNRLHDLSNMAAVRETMQRNSSAGQGDADSWDDSSSVSSGVSDNIDTDDINTSSSISSYANTPATQRKQLHTQPVTDAEKRVASSGDWISDGAAPGRKSQYSGQTVAQTGSWRRGMSAQVGVTSPRTKTSSSNGNSATKGQHTAKTDDVKVSEKGRLSPPSDSLDDPKKSSSSRSSTNLQLTQTLSEPAPSSLPSRTPNSCSSFGFKKPPGLVTASGATITSGSATLGKLPKSAQRPLTGGLKPGGPDVGVSMGLHDDGFLPLSARGTLQYRSLPRPGRSAARNGNRSSTSSIETAAALSVTNKNLKLTNQTDREKGAESGAGSASGGRQQVSSPTLRRLFGGKQSKQAPVTTAENMKNSTVISNLHVTTAPPEAEQRADSEQASTPGSVYSSSGPSGSLTWGTSMSTSSGPSRDGTLSTSSGPSRDGTLSTSSGPSRDGTLSISSVPSRDGTLSTSSGPSREGTLGLGASGSAGYPSVSSMHTSSESIDISNTQREESGLGRTGSTRTGLSERYGPAPAALRGQDEARDWLRSHSVSGLQESVGSSPFSPGSSLTSPSGTRFNFASSPTSAAQMNLTGLRNNSLTQDPGLDQTESRLRTSCMSLDDKTRTMSRSGSFREGFEEVHGSSLSLVSSTSSIYSTNEEKSQSEIRKLRRELDASQEKVSALTTQLSANAHLVAAFEQSLGNMTIRLKSLTLTAEQKDSELTELRKTIELLKKQNAVAQAAINGVINTQDLPNSKSVGPNASPQSQNKSETKTEPQSNQSPDPSQTQAQTPAQNPVQSSTPDLRIRRQHSSDSVSSITSHSSVGSNLEEARNRKKNKKNWVYELRSSFKQAFSKKKSPKSASSHSDIEEMTDSSLPASPQLPHNGSTPSGHMIRTTLSTSLLSECLDVEAETVMQLRSELREKEMKLTDIRLEALSSAHQLDQLRDAMNRMQVEIEKLKVENDRLRVESQSSRGSQASISSSPPAQSLCLGMTGQGPGGTSINLTTSESTSLDMLLDDTGESGLRNEGRHVKIYVNLDGDGGFTEDGRGRSFLIGCIGVSGKTKWDVLDGVVRRLFKEYISNVDPASQLGLSCDSVEGYSVGGIERLSSPRENHTPELLPCGYLVGESNRINIQLKGVSSGSVDSLVFDSLTPKPMVQRFVSLLKEHRRIILSGPSGTGKTHLANQLARFMVSLQQRPLSPGAIATFNVDHKSSKELRQYLSGLADQCSGVSGTDCPLVVILDNLHHVSSLGEIFNGLFSCSSQQSPFIIGTMSQATSSAPNLQLHHNFRWVLCANHTEPVKGFLGRFLRRKLLETEILSRSRDQDLVRIIDWIPRVWSHLNRFLETHSSSDVTIGPRLFLSCPMDVEGSRVWFTDLWNYSIVPYMLEAVREGLQLYGRRAVWEDPCLWVSESYPWSCVPSDWPPLLQLRPEDVGFDGYSAPRESAPRKEPPASDSDADPLMNMLLRLKEAATSSSPQSYDDSDSNSHHDDLLDQSLESTL